MDFSPSRKCRAALCALLCAALLGVAPTIRQSASSTQIASTNATVVFGADPTFTTNEEFCAIVFQSLSATAPTFSGVWTTIDSSTAEATSNYTIACRAVASGDALITTLSVLGTGVAHTQLIVWEIENFGIAGAGQITGSTSTTSPVSLTPSASPAGTLTLASIASYVTGASLGFTVPALCSGFTQDQVPAASSTTAIKFYGIAGNDTTPTTSCAMSVTVSSGATVTWTTYAMIFQIKSVAASCIFGSLALLGVGC
jgi:hypothetical protein